jgi:hypothetical protein
MSLSLSLSAFASVPELWLTATVERNLAVCCHTHIVIFSDFYYSLLSCPGGVYFTLYFVCLT